MRFLQLGVTKSNPFDFMEFLKSKSNVGLPSLHQSLASHVNKSDSLDCVFLLKTILANRTLEMS